MKNYYRNENSFEVNEIKTPFIQKKRRRKKQCMFVYAAHQVIGSMRWKKALELGKFRQKNYKSSNTNSQQPTANSRL